MSRRLICLALLVVSAVIVDGQEKRPNPATDKQNPASIQQSPQQAPSIVVIHQGEAADNRQGSENRPESYLSRLVAPEVLTNLLLVIVAGVTGYYIAKQAREAAASTKAMKDATDLQKAGMRQWVDVESVAVNTKGFSVTDGTELYLRFEATNNTPYLLAITKIVTKISYYAEKWEVFTVEPNAQMPSSHGRKPNPYTFYAILKRNGEEMAALLRGETIITINGEITFVDCLRNVEIQYFGGLYKVGPAEQFEYMRPVGLVPKQHTEQHP